ncbi:MAG: TIGR04133 family radical SAM/SPASM protein [Bacteroidales bacterium]|nr:TIGR04133 family radical SAM/SPASM protein [Bacteroidales bacterium]
MNKKPSLRKRIALTLFSKVKKNRAQMHTLNTLFWECTLRCNLSCLHCGSDCKAVANVPDMPARDFMRVIREIEPHVNPNHTMITFTGGEALLRDDLEACGLELYKRGFPWGLVSNGMLLNRKRLDSLLAAGLHSITISLDGFEEAHNWLRQHPQSYAKALNAVRMLTKEKEIVWDIVTCVNRKNLHQLNDFKEFLIANDVKDWRIFTIFPVGRAAQFPEFQLSNQEFTSVLDFIRNTRKEKRIRLSYGCEGFLGSYEMDVRDQFYQCYAGINVASVLADGSISACPSIRANFHQGNIYKDNFMDVWNNRFQPFRNRDWARTGLCADCSMFKYCEGNGMHLYDEDGKLLVCHYQRIV